MLYIYHTVTVITHISYINILSNSNTMPKLANTHKIPKDELISLSEKLGYGWKMEISRRLEGVSYQAVINTFLDRNAYVNPAIIREAKNIIKENNL